MEVCAESEDEEEAPPVPPRTLSHAPIIPTHNITDSSSDSSESTSSDVSTIPEDPSDDDDDNFDANSKLPPIPNGKNETSQDSQHEKERYNFSDEHVPADSNDVFHSCNNSSTNETANELRHRQRNLRNEAMKEKIQEIKRKSKEAENWPKKRRSLLISIVSSGVIILSFIGYIYIYVKS